MELKTTKDRILEAAQNCPQAEQTLKTLFPEMFECEEIDLWSESGIGVRTLFNKDGNARNSLISLRKFDNCFYLSNRFEWELKDNGDYFTLHINHKKK